MCDSCAVLLPVVCVQGNNTNIKHVKNPEIEMEYFKYFAPMLISYKTEIYSAVRKIWHR